MSNEVELSRAVNLSISSATPANHFGNTRLDINASYAHFNSFGVIYIRTMKLPQSIESGAANWVELDKDGLDELITKLTFMREILNNEELYLQYAGTDERHETT